MYELKFTKDVPALIIAAPPSAENSEEVTGLSPFEKTLFMSPIVVLSSNLILVISSNVAVPVFDELELINVRAPAAKSCGLSNKKLIPFEALLGTIENSSPSSGSPKKEILKPWPSIVCFPAIEFFKLSEVSFHKSSFSLYITLYSAFTISNGFVTKTATPTLDLLVGFSTALRLETVNICFPLFPSRSSPAWFTSLNFCDKSEANASISFKVSSANAKEFIIPLIRPALIWFVATCPIPTTGCNLPLCSNTSIIVVVSLPFVGLSVSEIIIGPEPVFPNLTSACPLLPYLTVICVNSDI